MDDTGLAIGCAGPVERIAEQHERKGFGARTLRLVGRPCRKEAGDPAAVGLAAERDGTGAIGDLDGERIDRGLGAADREIDREGLDAAPTECIDVGAHRRGFGAGAMAEDDPDGHGHRVAPAFARRAPSSGEARYPRLVKDTVDDRTRCWWAGEAGATGAPGPRAALMAAYHDDEWGVPVADDTELFERLILECFQAGLSWSTILAKREHFRAAFRGFDPTVVARFDDEDRARLLGDAGIVRNRAKIDAAIGNARAFLETVAEFGSFAAYLVAVVPESRAPLGAGATMADLAATTPGSDGLSRDLKGRGFQFVGSTIVYAFMQSVGLVDDHLPGCFRYRG